jgi:hypothetical protein
LSDRDDWQLLKRKPDLPLVVRFVYFQHKTDLSGIHRRLVLWTQNRRELLHFCAERWLAPDGKRLFLCLKLLQVCNFLKTLHGSTTPNGWPISRNKEAQFATISVGARK